MATAAGDIAGASTDQSSCPVASSTTTLQPHPVTPSSCSSSACPVPSTCPVAGTSDGVNPHNNIPPLSNDPTAAGLGVSRAHSSIPMSASTAPPGHQEAGAGVWVYPSEQMFYNAMKKKGWDPHADDMSTVVAIHNAVNERAWREVLAFESLHCQQCPNPTLKRFMGRPKDISPKARLLNFLGYKLPFDRHDWIVDRCGEEVRYVIDFYSSTPTNPGIPAAMHIDVRPALDSFSALRDRLLMQAGWIGSGRWLRE